MNDVIGGKPKEVVSWKYRKHVKEDEPRTVSHAVDKSFNEKTEC